jgi:hypothetical protein
VRRGGAARSYRLPPEVGGLLEAAYDDGDVGVGSVVDLERIARQSGVG